MRKMFFAAVAVCPMLIHAQAIMPAQPKPAAAMPVLVSGLEAPKAFAIPPASAEAAPLRISSGIKSPRLIGAANLHESTNWNWHPYEVSRHATVAFVVDANGTPTQLRIVHPLGGGMDQDVLAAVSHYRFEPGTLNHETLPMEVELKLDIRNHLLQ